MSDTEHPATVLCLWCNRVMDWGRKEILYDVCQRCVPTVVATIDEARNPRPAVVRSGRPVREVLRVVR
ncbi:MAG: hypothetical protein ACKVT1_00530 [Dehalococcoidia bacterium]